MAFAHVSAFSSNRRTCLSGCVSASTTPTSRNDLNSGYGGVASREAVPPSQFPSRYNSLYGP